MVSGFKFSYKYEEHSQEFTINNLKTNLTYHQILKLFSQMDFKAILELETKLKLKRHELEYLKTKLKSSEKPAYQITNNYESKMAELNEQINKESIDDDHVFVDNKHEKRNIEWSKQPHESYNSYGAKFDDNDNDENDDDHDETAMLKKLRLDELEKRYGLENHSHELEKLKKKNQSLQDALRVTEDLLASKLIDLRNKDRYIEALKEENRNTVVENQETIENILKENDRLRHELNEIRETVTVTATLKYKLQMRSKKE